MLVHQAEHGPPSSAWCGNWLSITWVRVCYTGENPWKCTVICFVLSRIFAIRKINPDMDDWSGRSGFFLTLSGSFCRERLSSIVLSKKPVPPLFREISGNLLTNRACGCIIWDNKFGKRSGYDGESLFWLLLLLCQGLLVFCQIRRVRSAIRWQLTTEAKYGQSAFAVLSSISKRGFFCFLPGALSLSGTSACGRSPGFQE